MNKEIKITGCVLTEEDRRILACCFHNILQDIERVGFEGMEDFARDINVLMKKMGLEEYVAELDFLIVE